MTGLYQLEKKYNHFATVVLDVDIKVSKVKNAFCEIYFQVCRFDKPNLNRGNKLKQLSKQNRCMYKELREKSHRVGEDSPQYLQEYDGTDLILYSSSAVNVSVSVWRVARVSIGTVGNEAGARPAAPR